LDRSSALGWIAVGLSTLVAALWAFWGAIEAFHEGWFEHALGARLLGVVAYLCPMLFTIALTILSIRLPRAGAVVFFVVGAWFTWWVVSSRRGATVLELATWVPVTLPLVAVGVLYWFGSPRPAHVAYWTAVGVPLLVAVVCGSEPGWRVAHRTDDGIRAARVVEGGGVALVWAPEGPGWVMESRDACSWDEARQRCAHLSEDGTTIRDELVRVWRLPTVAEAVGSMTRGGANAGGEWRPASRRATYRVRPDKESPLWDIYSPIIYWWTDTEAGPERAYRIVYNGMAIALPKTLRMGSQGFRAVRDVPLPSEHEPYPGESEPGNHADNGQSQ